MLMKMLPGLGIALALGVIFSLPGERARPRNNDVSREAVRAPGSSIFRTRNAGKREFVGYSPVLDSEGDFETTAAFDADDTNDELFAMAAPRAASRENPRTAVRLPAPANDVFADAPAEVRAGDAVALTTNDAPAKVGVFSSHAFGPKSESALASIGAAEMAAAPFIPSSAYPELPAKGITVWGAAESYADKQKSRGLDSASIYKQDGKIYTLGLKQDWSIDSVIGVSLDIHDAKVKGRIDKDTRRNEITGYVANANYYGTLLGRYPVEAKAFYGWFQHKGTAGENGFKYYDDTGYSWNEGKHRSTLYGVSAKAGIPLLLMDSLKVLPEAGVSYQRFTTRAYRIGYSFDNSMGIDVPETRSTSLAIPVSVTMKKDFPQMWGIVTPRMSYGATFELDDSAAGVRNFNSSAAGYMDKEPDGSLGPLKFDPVQKVVTHFGVGLDVKTLGGWNVSAEFERSWADKYSRDSFKMELGRCF